MSVTIDKEIQKAEVLAASLRKHLEEVGKHGVTEEGIKKMEELCVELREKDKEVEALHMELSAKVRANHLRLAELKEQLGQYRMTIRHHYLQPEWIKYGVQDKR